MSNYGEALPDLYRLDRINGWSIGMRAVTHALLASLSLPSGPLLELGCGSGIFNAELQTHFPNRLVLGADLHPVALTYASQTVGQPPPLLRADLQQLPLAPATVAAVFALDVFDQKGVDLSRALNESWRILQPGGLLLIRVSAHPWLEGAHDTAFNTGRRFRRSEIVELLTASGFQPQRLTYANSLLSPPLVAIRLLQRWAGWQVDEADLTDSAANRIFAQALQWEAAWLSQKDLAFGISLYAVAKKVTPA